MSFRTPIPGEYVDGVVVELISGIDAGITRPRLRPVTEFSPTLRVEFPRSERERFPVGTQFRLRLKVCQKHQGLKPKGPPYLRACEGTIQVIASSISDPGWYAVQNPHYFEGRAYRYELLA